MTTLVLYHKNCDDGFGAAFAAWKKLGDTASYLPIDYKDPIPLEAMTGKDVIVIDFCFNPDDTYQKILPVVASLTVIDHHRSALDRWKQHTGQTDENGVLKIKDGKLDMFFDLSRSGALLAWDHFHGTPAPRFIRHLSDMDLWTFTLDGTREVSFYLRSTPRDFAGWDAICARLETPDGVAHILEAGARITAFYDRQVDQIAHGRTVVPVTMTGTNGKTHKGLAVNATKLFASELGHILAEKSGTFAVIWETDGKTAACSMRSVNNFNCIPLAEAHGGGGHPQACGFNTTLETLLSLTA